MYILFKRFTTLALLVTVFDRDVFALKAGREIKNDQEFRNSNFTLKKCCPNATKMVKNVTDGSLSCVLREKNETSNESVRKFFNGGFPNCSFKTLENKHYRWFHYKTKVEVGLIYLIYPVWLETSDEYCIDSYTEDAEVKGQNDLIAFCDLQGIQDYYIKAGLAIFFVLGSAFLIGLTIIIYIVLNHIHKSREWLQFAIFSAEFLAHIIYGTIIILQSYFLTWTDDLKITKYLVYLGYYMYTVKFALVIATSLDLLICIWKPFLAADETRRTKRNVFAVIVCFTLPALIPGLTNLFGARYQDTYLNSNLRLIDGSPKLYGIITKVTYFVELGINAVLGCATAILLFRQRSKSKTNNQKQAHKKNRKAFIIYVKLICATEVPFFISFVLLVWFSASDSLSLWWNLTRGAFFISALYVFVFFGCSKKHRNHLSRIYTTTMSTASL